MSAGRDFSRIRENNLTSSTFSSFQILGGARKWNGLDRSAIDSFSPSIFHRMEKRQFQFPRNVIPDLSFFSIWLHLRSSTHRCLFITLSLYNFPFLILSIVNRIQIPRLNRGRNETRCSPEYWPINGQILPLFSGKRNGDIVDGALFTET